MESFPSANVGLQIMFDIANILLYYTEYEVDLCTLVGHIEE